MSASLQQYLTGMSALHCLFVSITHLIYLQHADNSQHAFSASSRPTLHNALPALERLYAEWEKALKKVRYETFKPALTTGMAKLDEYYHCSGSSDAHIIAMGMIDAVLSSMLINTSLQCSIRHRK
jgi:hypothetical protein